jgi:allophanate hydrolase subunit 2
MLKADDVIACGQGKRLDRPRRLPIEAIPRYPSEIQLRAVPGPQDDFFIEGLETLFHSAYMVSAKADRMGYRLQGAPIRQKEGMPQSIISEPSMPGGIQIPADAQPIILLVEQTVGGYTKIATVISTDLPRVAQATPGDKILFESVTLEAAHQIYAAKAKQLLGIAEQLAG